MRRFFSNSLYIIFFLILFTCCIFFKKEVSAGVSFGINYSLSVLIPSLFPLMFLAALVSVSPVSQILSKIFSPIARFALKLPACTAPAVIFGLTCGYPVGAKLCAQLLKNGKINKEEAERLMLFAMNPGLAFTVLFVGGTVLKSMELGLLIFAATAFSSILIGIGTGIKKNPPPRLVEKTVDVGFSTAVNLAAKSTLSATCSMCLYVVIFSALMPLLHSLNAYGFFVRLMANPFFTQPQNAAIFTFIFDVIHGVNDSLRLHAGARVLALGLSFGGLCIHLQIFSFFDKIPVSLPKFYIARLVHGGLTMIIFSCLLTLFPQAIGAFSSLATFTPMLKSGTATGSICLVILSLTYIYMNTGVEKERII